MVPTADGSDNVQRRWNRHHNLTAIPDRLSFPKGGTAWLLIVENKNRVGIVNGSQ
jgi:hypothetical protein